MIPQKPIERQIQDAIDADMDFDRESRGSTALPEVEKEIDEQEDRANDYD